MDPFPVKIYHGGLPATLQAKQTPEGRECPGSAGVGSASVSCRAGSEPAWRRTKSNGEGRRLPLTTWRTRTSLQKHRPDPVAESPELDENHGSPVSLRRFCAQFFGTIPGEAARRWCRARRGPGAGAGRRAPRRGAARHSPRPQSPVRTAPRLGASDRTAPGASPCRRGTTSPAAAKNCVPLCVCAICVYVFVCGICVRAFVCVCAECLCVCVYVWVVGQMHCACSHPACQKLAVKEIIPTIYGEMVKANHTCLWFLCSTRSSHRGPQLLVRPSWHNFTTEWR